MPVLFCLFLQNVFIVCVFSDFRGEEGVNVTYNDECAQVVLFLNNHFFRDLSRKHSSN